MTGTDYGHLTYLVLLGAAVVFWFFTNHRQSFGKTLQQAMAWVLIFLGMIAAVAMWDDIRSVARPVEAVMSDADRIEIPRSVDGHYRLVLGVNGTPVEFVVDTGATDMVLSLEDAKRVGFDIDALPFVGRALTANGEVKTAPVILSEVTIGDHTDRRVPARVNGGDLFQSLLGMTYLQRFDQITITGGRLILTR